MKPRYEKQIVKMQVFKRKGLGYFPHFHNHVEFMYITSGKCLSYIDGEKVVLNEDEMLILFPNQLHLHTNEFEHEGIMMIFPSEMAKKYNDYFYSFLPENNVIKGDKSFKNLLEVFIEDFDNASDEVRTGYVLTIMTKLFEKLSLVKVSSDKSHIIKSVINYMREHFKEDLKLEKVAADLNMSKFYLSHIFSGKIDISFKDYMHTLRVDEARKLLEETNLSVPEISERCGFNALRTFNRAFKKITTLSPTEYRKNNT